MTDRQSDGSTADGDGSTAPGTPAPETNFDALDRALSDADAAAFVHVGDRFDDDMRYLTRFSGPDREYAFVYTPDGGVLCAPSLFEAQARREFDGEVRTANAGDPAGVRARAVLDELTDSETVLAPRSIPHDAAVYLERGGYDVASTDAVAAARAVKTDAELDCLRRVQRAAAAGMRRAETVLAEATPEGDELVWAGDPLSTERLRREANAELAARGVTDTGNTVVGAGPTCADLHYTGTAAIQPGETVLLDISPRGPHGYYGDLSRTYVVASDGGWERRAYVAVESALDVALSTVEPGVPAGTVHAEVAAELAAYGFDPEAAEGEAGFTHGAGHGVGLSLHEGPSLRAETELRPGHVITLEPGVYDPERGGVRLEELVVVTEEGCEILHEHPRSFAPRGE
ncbi:M24 family metallopeptidase [Halopelagius longus]|uniref:Aminopeptidase P family protein n=1 Tax=Halopelagius longus TaxID=1236180 RepID=A0A1H1DX56_9EURY|nr:Xaa-Pro peptidase family protein [Halopelagius longus]RDI71509.1 aminopeptidase P family protein [Halopelagius longus]SDQ81037.1 Xaa-Pro aminopeptidase [Halopelagius longus]